MKTARAYLHRNFESIWFEIAMNKTDYDYFRFHMYPVFKDKILAFLKKAREESQNFTKPVTLVKKDSGEIMLKSDMDFYIDEDLIVEYVSPWVKRRL